MPLPYYTYILQGFKDLGVMSALRFRRLDAPLGPDAEGAAMHYDGGAGIVKLFVSTGDSAKIGPGLLEWADVYGKVNVDETSDASSKIVALGPTFGVAYWALPHGYVVASRMA